MSALFTISRSLLRKAFRHHVKKPDIGQGTQGEAYAPQACVLLRYPTETSVGLLYT